jgi:NAD(P)H-hydrate epimerase
LTIPLPSSDGHALDLSALPKVAAEAKRMKAIALGPGVGQAEGTQQFVRKAVAEIQLPMVIDADALNALAGHLDILRTRRAGTILTPHPGEMSRLTGLTTAKVQADRIGVARKLASDCGVVVVLKGAQTVVADPDGSAYINPTGNTGLAKGGSGDVLTGLIAGLLAQNGQALPAALCGAFLHGLAADLAADSVPPRAMIASDVIEHLPKAFRAVLKV